MQKTKDICVHYDRCGGCSIQDIPYEEQLENKKKMLLDLFKEKEIDIENFENILASPEIYEYRNNMEFSFGDLKKGGELQLGMHPRGRRFDVITVDNCLLVDQDFRDILSTILEYCRENNFKKYHIKLREGFLRNLVVRKGINTGEVVANLITTSQVDHDFNPLVKKLNNLNLNGELVGFIQTINDDFSDQVSCDEMIVYHGRNYFYDKLLNNQFKIDSLSFFQTNTKGAELLYSEAEKYIESANGKVVFDLYCGAGTISQSIAADAAKIYGIEIDSDAVEHAKENAKLNGVKNAKFIAGDVLKEIDNIDQKADLIIIDPPRPGINPKALEKIAAANSKEILYISCNPKSLARDLKELELHNYTLQKFKAIDMFPHTKHLEVISLLKKE
ncbi:RNA methyltransferase, TrmA family [Halanaerobium saccharolyticum subsp. saccharolyticum DSM 6643]|uniref:RNA methyltransferase, TrmA family n=1 Tax=Halanaerobium saccharolyticum subsp. saccharolyticum DSM 6643 TaxID=1293054 RepID=M5DYE3_9FIRM|nr:23S rRNA (uracil(1939)-C(5))-methyltransferase RlmD [Halanaerobium saccharolyticum]CCU78030.1 RNA methyltransferase, TrmA family [Halanaerobium saccharolyticum subsp. saccharolyticum DSM 6643]